LQHVLADLVYKMSMHTAAANRWCERQPTSITARCRRAGILANREKRSPNFKGAL
jgi:hypothetical protein